MVCKKCGAETLQENAVYCGECGARLDGKVKCFACGEFNDETTKFCIYCGTRVDGKKVCSCGTEYSSKFCPNCGKSDTAQTPQPTVQRVPAPKKPVSAERKAAIWNKGFGYISGGVALLGVLFAIIFTFFIGLNTSVVGNVASLGLALPTEESMNLFYYFGDAYKEIGAMQDSLSVAMVYTDVMISSMTATAIIGTVLSVAIIAGVLGFAVPAVIAFVKWSTGKSEDLGARWSVCSMLTFLLGAAAIYALNALSAGIVVDTSTLSTDLAMEMEIGARVGFNGATVAGIVLTAICLVLYTAACLVGRGKEWKNAQFIKATCFAVGGALLTFVVYAIMKGAYVGMTFVEGASANEIVMNGSLTSSMTMLFSLVNTVSERVAKAAQGCMTAAFVCQLFEMLCILGILVCAAMSIVARARSLDGVKARVLGWNIAIVALSAVVLVLGIVGQVQTQMIMNTQYKYAQTPVAQQTKMMLEMSGAIVGLVFALLNLAASIVEKAMTATAAVVEQVEVVEETEVAEVAEQAEVAEVVEETAPAQAE